MEWVRLGDLGEIVTGNTPSKKNSEYYENKDIPFIGPSDIKNFRKLNYINESENFISDKARNKARIVPKNSLLVTCIGNIGKVAKVETEEIAFNQQINAILVNNKNFGTDYIGYALIFNQKRLESISNAPVVPIINKTSFSDFKIRIDKSLENQNKISETLKFIEKIIGFRKEQIQAYDDLIESLLKKLISNPENKKILLDKFLEEITAGKSLAGKDKTFYKVLKTSCVFTGHFDDTEWKYLPKDYMPQEKHIIKEGDILVSRMNTSELVGASVYVYKDYEDLTVPDRLWILKLKNNISKIYLWKFFQTNFYRNQIQNISTGTSGSMKNISQKNFRNLEVIYPPIELQNKFADYVLKIEEEKKKLNSSLLELESLFDSLMEDAFSGNLFKD